MDQQGTYLFYSHPKLERFVDLLRTYSFVDHSKPENKLPCQVLSFLVVI